MSAKSTVRTIVLGGVGGDAHSIGVVTLRRALERAGHEVHFLSTQNSVVQLCRAAQGADVVLVSNMDGHARHYLDDLPALRQEHPSTAVWYLGGNPSVHDDPAMAETELAPLGFDRVYLGYIEPEALLATLKADLAGRPWAPPSARPVEAPHPADARRPSPPVPLVDFDEQRTDVLAQWATGSDARALAVNADRLRSFANLSEQQGQADREHRTLVHPRTGVADLVEQRRLFGVMAAAGADVLSFQIDSLTRNNSYEQIELLLKGHRMDETQPQLNGFPMVNHGVGPIVEMLKEHGHIPFQVRHSTRDPRLLAEIAYASGVAAFEGGPLTYNLPYFRDYNPRDSLAAWDYVEILTGRYLEEHGIRIDREFFGVLTAALVPPALAIAVDVLESLWSARRGVRSVSLGYAEQGHRVQDVTAIWALGDLAAGYLADQGHVGVTVSTVFHQYMAAFPQQPAQARAVLTGSARTAAMSGATRLMLKTEVESRRIPTASQNAQSMLLVRGVLDRTEPVDRSDPAYADEYERVVQEARAVLDAVLSLPGDLGDQITTAVACGWIDVPFSPSRWNRGAVLPLRDRGGAVRLAQAGQLPLSPEMVRRHEEETAARLNHGQPLDAALEHDLLSVGRGEFDSWPLDC